MKLPGLYHFAFILFPLCSLGQTQQDSLKQNEKALNQQYTELYKENSELSYTLPLGEIGAPSKYIIEGRLTNLYLLFGTRNSKIAFALIPDFTVRVRSEKSAGVRTPSFRLGGTAFYRLGRSNKSYKYAELGFTHHSNGQDGDALHTDGTINTQTGNFSTNYLTASYRFGRDYPAAQDNNSYSLNHRAGLEWHKWFNYEPILENDYGFTRLLYDLSWRKYTAYFSNVNSNFWKKGLAPNKAGTEKLEKESLRVNLSISYAINQMREYNLINFGKRLNAEASLHASFPFMSRAMLMLGAGYYGEDPYNIYYLDHYPFMRLGISTGFLRYQTKSKQPK